MKHDDLDAGVFESSNAYQQQKSWRRVFDSVVAGYLAALSASPLVASNSNDEVITRRLGPALIHFKIDVEHSTTSALKSQALCEVWQKIVEGEDVPIYTVNQIVSKCAPVYQRRGLIPYNYFRQIKRGTPGMQRVKVAA